MGAAQPNGGADGDGGEGGSANEGNGGDGGGRDGCGPSCTAECLEGHCVNRIYDLHAEGQRFETTSVGGSTRAYVLSKGGESQSASLWNFNHVGFAYPTTVAETNIQGDAGFLLATTAKEALYARTTGGMQRCYFDDTFATGCTQLTAEPNAAGMIGTATELYYVDPTAQRLAKLDVSGVTLLEPPLPDFPPAAGMEEAAGSFFIAMTGGAIVRAQVGSSGSLTLVTTANGFGEVAPELVTTPQFVYFRAKIPPTDRYGLFRLPLGFAADDPAEAVCSVMDGPEARTVATNGTEIFFDYEVTPGIERLVRISAGPTLPNVEECLAAPRYRGYSGATLIGVAGYVVDAVWFTEGTSLYRAVD